MKPTFFATPKDFRDWLHKNHLKETELLVGFFKTGSGKPSITWPESVDQAICFGWIDGVRKTIDEHSYTIRFTPRKAGSIWSAINIAKVASLQEKGLMFPAGIAIFEKRKTDNTKKYSFEQDKENVKLTPAHEKAFKANKVAWKFFTSQAAGYQHQVTWYIQSAKQEATREKRLQEAIEFSAREEKVERFIKYHKKK
ncbi:YdeI family protein [Chitinophaga sp. Cy-1792]|uniref:YdeI/OmpD-associated family protein n=1 Tax=Chitinophaga sp. Cy-1792 TaxID=2608339 RepID=UPI00142486AB|nr:YdeI/OmpD-associated family protein [Chitinophaga sp. Cy-1792]NIG51902.1 bacteriocin-protection protein [Chitinophaga sp. Cy-1792]